MIYDYSKLSGRIVEKCGTRRNFAKLMGLSEKTIHDKLDNDISWKQSEMQKASEILDFPESDIQSYFFTLKAQ